MTRFGVSNHLGVLEAADLISTVKRPWRYDTVVSSDWAQGSGYTNVRRGLRDDPRRRDRGRPSQQAAADL